jgi:CheY-like chemotaxis protein
MVFQLEGRPVAARVLLVDDDVTIRETTALRLQVEGHQVIAVGDACAALDAAADGMRRGTPVDVAVLDVEAPGVDDVTLLAQLRQHHVVAALPVVFYTGNPGAALRSLSLADSVPTSGHPLNRLLATILSMSPPA